LPGFLTTSGFVRLDFNDARQVRLFLAGFTGLFLLRIGSVAVAFMAMSPVINEFRQSLAAIEPDSRIMVMTDDRHKKFRLLWTTSYAEDRKVSFALNHAPALAATERSSYVPIVFAQPGKQILQVRPEYSDLRYREDRTPLIRQFQELSSSNADDTSSRIKDWQRSFDYLYVMFTRPDDPVPFPNLELLVPRASTSGFIACHTEHSIFG
jgi:hypothetical protein